MLMYCGELQSLRILRSSQEPAYDQHFVLLPGSAFVEGSCWRTKQVLVGCFALLPLCNQLISDSAKVRLWGWKENGVEVAKDLKDLSALAKAGKPLYGSTDLPEYVQGVSHRNSMWSQLKFGTLPWYAQF